LREFVQRFGYTFNVEKKNIAKSINSLLTKSSGKKEQHIIDTLALRAMSKAIYTTQNIGHYGLAFSHYTHFTSPIRRYSDVLVHRLLIQYQNEPKQGTAQDLEAACEHASNREQLATKAERDSIKYMQVVYMQNQIGKTYDGVISGVTERGIFVELNENKCEGMIRVADIEGDYFVFLDKEFALVGQRTKKVFELGDPITIRVKKADVIKRHLDFVLA
jgi:ribonuclease R/exosome complex exonuclease DIS3/RRP44